MKKQIKLFFVLLMIFSLLLTGCGGGKTPDKTEFIVSFNLNGGSPEKDNVVVKKDEKLLIDSEIPEKAEYVFKGWLFNGELLEIGSEIEVIEDIELVAVWEKKTAAVDDPDEDPVEETPKTDDASKVIKTNKLEVKTSLNLDMTETSTLKVTVLPNNATDKGLSFTSSNTKVATVNSKGKVTPKGRGTAKITVSAKDGGSSATVNIKVTRDVTKLSLVINGGWNNYISGHSNIQFRDRHITTNLTTTHLKDYDIDLKAFKWEYNKDYITLEELKTNDGDLPVLKVTAKSFETYAGSRTVPITLRYKDLKAKINIIVEPLIDYMHFNPIPQYMGDGSDNPGYTIQPGQKTLTVTSKMSINSFNIPDGFRDKLEVKKISDNKFEIKCITRPYTRFEYISYSMQRIKINVNCQ